MYKQPIPKKLKLLGLTVVFLIIAFMVFEYFNFSYLGTNPGPSQTYNWTAVIEFKFNKSLISKGLSVSMTPNSLYGNYKVKGNLIEVPLSVPLSTQTTYSITVNSVYDNHGQELKNLVYTFKPKSISVSSLPDYQKYDLISRNEASPVYKDPILKHLPYDTIDFSLAATFPAGKNNIPSLVLVAKINVPAAYTGSLAQQVTNQYEQEVQSYISSLGLNPSSYTIDYVVNSN